MSTYWLNTDFVFSTGLFAETKSDVWRDTSNKGSAIWLVCIYDKGFTALIQSPQPSNHWSFKVPDSDSDPINYAKIWYQQCNQT